MYLEDIKNIKAISEEEEKTLLADYLNGDDIAKNRLIEGYMMYAATLVKPFLSKGEEAIDLISESHLALTVAVNSYKSGDLKLQIKETVEKRLNEILKDKIQMKKTDDELAARLNNMMEVSGELAKELGRQASVFEIAKRLLIPEEEAEELLKISLNAINLNKYD